MSSSLFQCIWLCFGLGMDLLIYMSRGDAAGCSAPVTAVPPGCHMQCLDTYSAAAGFNPTTWDCNVPTIGYVVPNQVGMKHLTASAHPRLPLLFHSPTIICQTTSSREVQIA
jgi:hypothetical protein